MLNPKGAAQGSGLWVSRQDLAQAAVVFGQQNVIPWDYYDTQTIANGNAAANLQFFTNTKGAQGVYVTNLEQANILQSGKQLFLSAIDLDIFATAGQVAGSLADFYSVIHSKGVYTLQVNGKDMVQGPISDLVGGGLYGFGTPAAYNQYAAKRVIKRSELDGAILIPTSTTFTLEFDWSAAVNPAATVGLRVNFRGQLVRLATA